MKKFKLILATVLVFVMTFALVACSSPIVGEWELVKLQTGGFSWTGDDLADEFGEMEYVFNGDGTGELTLKENGYTTNREFEWEINEDGDELTLDYENGASVEGDIEFDGDKFKLEFEGTTFTFKKK